VQPVRVAMQLARDMLYQWQNARQRKDAVGHHDSSNVIRWQPPTIGKVKCNVDADLFNEQHKFGIGMCI
jgi:hypothetical protein